MQVCKLPGPTSGRVSSNPRGECPALKRATWSSSLDAFNGFWQFPLAVDSQEVYSVLTKLGLFTPARLIQGSTDSAHAFQAGVMEVFEDMLYICVLIWIDDVLVYTRSLKTS